MNDELLPVACKECGARWQNDGRNRGGPYKGAPTWRVMHRDGCAFKALKDTRAKRAAAREQR